MGGAGGPIRLNMLGGTAKESARLTGMGCDHCGRASPRTLALKCGILRHQIQCVRIKYDWQIAGHEAPECLCRLIRSAQARTHQPCGDRPAGMCIDIDHHDLGLDSIEHKSIGQAEPNDDHTAGAAKERAARA